MRDLGTLVVEQGTILDRIDANIADTAVRVSLEPGASKAIHGARKRLSMPHLDFKCGLFSGVFHKYFKC